MSGYIDSHTHLADPAFGADREAVIERARYAGAEALVCIGESIEAAERARGIAAALPAFIYWTAGVHPHDAAGFEPSRDVAAIAARLEAGAVAVGECGLDYHYDNSPRDAQIAAFRAQLELAAERDVPVVVHTRDAEEDTAALISEAARNGVRGVLHCYTGSLKLASTALDAGWYISFSGIITFRKWTDDELLRLVSDDRLLVESDAPYLAPVPHRGKRNEPAFVPRTIERLALARESSPASIAAITAANARALFRLPPASSASDSESLST
ncbi:MAG TPA: TatD family hydrolase [Gemmatimonadaceae bacterium]|nr:TatD family hydrolase [Gemmatimonadaceae bacterium]